MEALEKEPVFYWSAHKELWNRIIKRIPDIFKTAPGLRPSIDTVKREELLAMFEDGTLAKLTNDTVWENAIEYDCFACQYDLESDPEEERPCSHCPLIWSLTGSNRCIQSTYDNLCQAYYSNDAESAIKFATQVRDALVKDGVKTL